MALSTTQTTAITDSIGKALLDYNTSFVTGTSTARTNINNGVGGTGATATVGRVLAYAAVPDLSDELSLLPKANTIASNVSAYLSGIANLNSAYNQFLPLLDSLDTAQAGLNAFLTTNTLQVDALFTAAFNYYVTNAATLGYRTAANLPIAIATANYFPYATTDDLWDITFSGATTFSTNAVGTSVSTAATGGGVGTIYIYKVNASNAIGGAAITVTYTNAAGNGATVVYNTTSGTPAASGSLATGYTLGVAGQAITVVTATGGTSAEQYRFGIKLVRAVGY
jgi:hypothetical protein